MFIGAVAGTLYAQPAISTSGVLNAASYSRPPLPNSGIAQGSMFLVFGSNLGPAALVQASSFPLQTTQGIGGTTVQANIGGTNVACIMVYSSAGQVAAIMPSTAPVGAGQLTVTYNGQTSAAVPITVVKSSFGAFALNQGGSGPGIITDVNYRVNTLVAPATLGGPQTPAGPAKPGDSLTLWGTGLGPISADETQAITPVDLRSTIPVELFVGGQKANVTFAGRVGNGLDQINFVVPPGLQGCFVNVAVRIGAIVSNLVSIAVDPSGSGACSDANGFSSEDLMTLRNNGGFKLGSVLLSRNNIKITSGTTSIGINYDSGAGIFGNYALNQLIASQGPTQVPSVGTCATNNFKGLDPNPIDPVMPTILDAGSSLTVSGGATKQVPKTSSGVYNAIIGGVSLAILIPGSGATVQPNYLNPGTYTVSGGGSGGVGSFSAQISVPGQLNWTNSAQINDITRSQDLEIDWAGSDPNSLVAIVGISSTGGELNAKGQRVPNAETPGAAFECIVPASAGKFVVPAHVLQNLPATLTDTIVAPSYLLVGNFSAPVRFSAAGLDAGYLTYRVLYGKNVNFK